MRSNAASAKSKHHVLQGSGEVWNILDHNGVVVATAHTEERAVQITAMFDGQVEHRQVATVGNGSVPALLPLTEQAKRAADQYREALAILEAAMKPGPGGAPPVLRAKVHYYDPADIRGGRERERRPGDSERRTLAQPGSTVVAALFGGRIAPRPPRVELVDGHIDVISCADVVHHETGDVMATGYGFASTREPRYGFRWVGEREIPSHLDKERLEQRKRASERGTWVQYRIPNVDEADQYNTVLKMSAKRAAVAAAIALPAVAECFTQDLEEKIRQPQGQQAAAAQQIQSAPAPAAATMPGSPPPGATPPAGTGAIAPAEPEIPERERLIGYIFRTGKALQMKEQSIRAHAKSKIKGKEIEDMTDEELRVVAGMIDSLVAIRRGNTERAGAAR